MRGGHDSALAQSDAEQGGVPVIADVNTSPRERKVVTSVTPEATARLANPSSRIPISPCKVRVSNCRLALQLRVRRRCRFD